MDMINEIDINHYLEKYGQTLFEYVPSIVTAILILVVGWFVIKMITKITRNLLNKRNVELTLKNFLLDVMNWVLKALLFITVVSQLGVQTSSFVAIIGAAGLAIGLALQGSLANFAGGMLIMIFKPFKIGDFIEAQGESGTVKNIAIFYTQIITINNQLVILPNGKLSNDGIKNFTTEGKRRDVITIRISYDSDIKKAKDILVGLMTEQENILEEPAPVVFVAELNDSSVDLSLRFWALNEHFWACHFFIIEEAKTRLEDGGIVIPFPQRDVHHYNLDDFKPKAKKIESEKA